MKEKKISKKVMEVEPATFCVLVHCSTIFTNTFSSLFIKSFILKVNHAQFKQNKYNVWMAGREPWTFG